MALGSTQPLTEMSTGSISCGVKTVGVVVVTESGNLNFLEPCEHLRPVMGLIYLYILFYGSHCFMYDSHCTVSSIIYLVT